MNKLNISHKINTEMYSINNLVTYLSYDSYVSGLEPVIYNDYNRLERDYPYNPYLSTFRLLLNKDIAVQMIPCKYRVGGELWENRSKYEVPIDLPEVEVVVPDEKYITVTSLSGDSTVEVGRRNTSCWTVLEYSDNGVNWNPISSTIDIHQGDEVYIRGRLTSTPPYSAEGTLQLIIKGNAKLSGNINALFDYTTDDLGKNFKLKDYCAFGLFKDSIGLVDASELILPSDALSETCYANMFWGCNNLISTPKLPATKLAAGCYSQMFRDCTSLTSVPTILPAMDLSDRCYRMMFYNCEALTNSPILPATRLNYAAYYRMFYGCRNINKVECYASDFGNQSTYEWLYSVEESGTFKFDNRAEAEWSSGASGIPTGWTKIEVCQELFQSKQRNIPINISVSQYADYWKFVVTSRNYSEELYITTNEDQSNNTIIY